MSSATPMSLAARKRLREHQFTSARVLAHQACARRTLAAPCGHQSGAARTPTSSACAGAAPRSGREAR